MSEESGVGAGPISLPMGGGAIEGIGETFSPDLYTGTGNLTVPIDTPAGRNGFGPSLSLQYSSGNGNGQFGHGWSLSIPSVTRRTADGVPVYEEGADGFVVPGVEELVAVEQTEDATVYRPRTEGSFDRIRHVTGGSDDYWEVESTDGTVNVYGTPGAAPADPAAIADPEDRSKVFAWKLTAMEDQFGNRVEYGYERDLGSTVDETADGRTRPAFDQLYPVRIQYVHHDAGDPGHLVSVAFEYEDRPDPFSRRRAGFEVRTRKRCARIAVRTHPDGAAEETRSYELTYRDETGELPANGLSQLVQIDVVGHDGDDSQSFPPLEFGYTAFDPGERSFDRLTGELPDRSLGSDTLELADLDGNGLPDLVEIDETIRYWENLGDGEFDEPQGMDRSPAGLSLADEEVRLMDVDGDGRIDLQATKDGLAGYFPQSFDGGWSEESFQPYDVVPTVPLDDPSTSLVDLNGDGVTDAIQSGQLPTFFENDPETGWSEARPGRSSEFPNVDFADERVRLADMNGDGLLDIVLVHDGSVSYWPNYGHGRWGKKHRMADSPRLPHEYDPSRLYLGDVDGDGAADLVLIGADEVRLWLNQSGNGWSDGIEIDGTPPVATRDAVRLVDLYGQGISGVFWGPVSDGSDRRAHFLDFTGGTKPYLLDETQNNMGATTRIEYEPSTRFSTAAAVSGEPWKTSLPTPTWVVSQLEAIDRISRSRQTSVFEYRHGYWDGVEREFRGFGMVEQRDTEQFETFTDGVELDGTAVALSDPEQFSPPRVTRTWFHQGGVGPPHDWRELTYEDEYWDGDPGVLSRPSETTALLRDISRDEQRNAIRSLRGRKLRTEVYGADESPRADTPYRVTEHAYRIREEVVGTADRPGVYFPHGVGKRQTNWERGDEPQTTLSYTGERDEYGQPLSRTEIACPRDWTPGGGDEMSGYETTHTELEYAQRDDETAYIVDRPAQSRTYEVTPSGSITVSALLAAARDGSAPREVVSETLTHYDGPAFEGLPVGELGEFGAAVRTEELVLTQARLSAAYPDGSPAALQDGTDAFPEDYPEEYISELRSRAGYRFRDGSGHGHGGHYALTTRKAFDFQPETDARTSLGLTVATKDAVGNRRDIDHDRFNLKPVRVKNAEGLETSATYDYLTLQPEAVTDPNNNRTRVRYAPLGLVAAKATMGAPTEEVGDTLDQPTVSYDYELRLVADGESLEPSYVEVTRRNVHRWDVVHAANERRAANGEDPLDEAGVADLFRDELASHPDRFSRTRIYSDGFGRTVQTRRIVSDTEYRDATTGEDVLPADQSVTPGAIEREVTDDARVVVSGWTTYDNKGNGVEKYEPFYATGLGFQSRREAITTADGTDLRKADVRYDPLGRVRQRINPDGSESRTVRGVPHDLSEPSAYRPTPWRVFMYDPNDNAGRTHAATSREFDHHWNTPTSKRFDPKGRPIEITERARTDPEVPDSAIEEHVTRNDYDVAGNVISVRDPLGREVVSRTYDLADNRLRSEQLDGGPESIVLDAAGNQLERRGPRGERALQRYDGMNRPTSLWARDEGGAPLTRRQRIVYAEHDTSDLSTTAARDRNALGDVRHHYDGAGRVTFERYDLQGNPERKHRQTTRDQVALEGPIDWTPADGQSLSDIARDVLEAERYRTEFEHDAQNRRTLTVYPEDVRSERRAVAVEYTGTGRLDSATLQVRDAADAITDERPLVEETAFNAMGEPTLLAYGNDTLATYAYNDATMDLARQRIEGYERQDALLTPNGTVHRDVGYELDRSGNVQEIRHTAPGSGVANTPEGRDELVREFDYDALYRLTRATGRVCTTLSEPSPHGSQTPCGHDPPGTGMPHVTRSNAPGHTSKYRESYEYDPAGNLTRLHHASGDGASWVRQFGMGDHDHQDWEQIWQANRGSEWSSPPSNEVTHVNAGQGGSPTHFYDDAGNLEEDSNSKYQWNHAGRLVRYREESGGSTSVEARYLYDANGRRVKKIVDKGPNHREVTVYATGTFEHRREETPNGADSNLLDLQAGGSTVAQLRVDSPDDTGDVPPLQYQFTDYLGNSTITVDGDGEWVNYEEYTPYGETTFGGYRRKRYRFNGKERDGESGLYYYGARYYAPWLARWTRPDPAGLEDGWNLYRYVKNNPMRFADPAGEQSEPPDDGNSSGGSSQGWLDYIGEKATQGANAMIEGYWNMLEDGATSYMRKEMNEHRKKVILNQLGVGKYYGTKSDFAEKSKEEKIQQLKDWGAPNREQAKATLDDMKSSNCINWVLSVLKAGYTKVDKEGGEVGNEIISGKKNALEDYEAIEQTVRKKGNKANVLLQELQKRGWKIIYLNADTSKNTTDSSGNVVFNSTYEYGKVKEHGGRWGLTVDEMLVDFDTASGGNSSTMQKLKQVSFFVGMARGGYHSFVGGSGDVSEFHRGRGPTMKRKRYKKIIEETPIETFFGERSNDPSWQSGFIAVPPDEWSK